MCYHAHEKYQLLCQWARVSRGARPRGELARRVTEPLRTRCRRRRTTAGRGASAGGAPAAAPRRRARGTRCTWRAPAGAARAPPGTRHYTPSPQTCPRRPLRRPRRECSERDESPLSSSRRRRSLRRDTS